MQSSPPPRVNYGIDAPTLVLRFFVIGVAGTLLGASVLFVPQSGPIGWIRHFAPSGIWTGVPFLATAIIMFRGSKVGKLHLRDRVIASIPWNGHETVLDVGCGHGLLLIAAAKQLTTGRAVGVDLWQLVDQSGNCRDATLQNVQLEQVADRVTIKDGDARQLEFPDNTFDVILSSWAIHNIYEAPGREGAIREMVRVLKPGGRMIIVDIQHIRQYAAVLQQCRMQEITKTGPHLLFVIPTFTVAAVKPIA